MSLILSLKSFTWLWPTLTWLWPSWPSPDLQLTFTRPGPEPELDNISPEMLQFEKLLMFFFMQKCIDKNKQLNFLPLRIWRMLWIWPYWMSQLRLHEGAGGGGGSGQRQRGGDRHTLTQLRYIRLTIKIEIYAKISPILWQACKFNPKYQTAQIHENSNGKLNRHTVDGVKPPSWPMWFKCQPLFQILLISFLAPTGAQEVAISVCLSVPLAESCLDHSIFIFLAQILHDDFRMTSGWLQEDFRMTS